MKIEAVKTYLTRIENGGEELLLAPEFYGLKRTLAVPPAYKYLEGLKGKLTVNDKHPLFKLILKFYIDQSTHKVQDNSNPITAKKSNNDDEKEDEKLQNISDQFKKVTLGKTEK